MRYPTVVGKLISFSSLGKDLNYPQNKPWIKSFEVV